MHQDLKSLLSRVTTGDSNAFGQIFHQYSGKVYVFALKLTRSETMAEEIVQEIFMKIWLQRQSLLSIDYFPSYLYTLTKNHTFNVLKRLALEENAKAALGKELSETHHGTEEAVIYHDYENLLGQVLDRLPPQQRLIYSLCHQKGLKYEEVAARLKISRLTVKTHMQQALRTIKLHFSSLVSFWTLTILFA
jgi:RNA polymerase sigma-70 factor (ECF subfamily)